MAAEQNIDAERAAFEAWYIEQAGESRKFMLGMSTECTYGYGETEAMWEAWQAARRTPSASIGEDGLPEPPWGSDFEAWLEVRTGHEVRTEILQYARDAIAADRRARVTPEMWASLHAAQDQVQAAAGSRADRRTRLSSEQQAAAHPCSMPGCSGFGKASSIVPLCPGHRAEFIEWRKRR